VSFANGAYRISLTQLKSRYDANFRSCCCVAVIWDVPNGFSPALFLAKKSFRTDAFAHGSYKMWGAKQKKTFLGCFFSCLIGYHIDVYAIL
jgi:hypothetical protein